MISQDVLNRIIGSNGGRFPVISMYLGIGPDKSARSQVASLLHRVRPLSEDRSLEHDVRLSMRADLQRIEGLAHEERLQPGGLGIFASGGNGFFEQVSLPRPVRDRIVVDATPWVRPMLAVLDEYHRMCVVLVDKARAQVWELYLGEMREVAQIKDPALRKPNFAAGMAEHRVRNKADELSKHHYRRVGSVLDELLRTEGFDVVALGGHPHEMPAVTGFLSRDVAARVAGTFAADPDTATVADIRRSAEAIMQRHERDEEQRLVGEIFAASAEGRPAAIGLEPCLWAGSVAAVQHLVIDEGAAVPGVVCDGSGWLGAAGEECPLCARPTRPTPDVLDELAEFVVEEGGAVEHVAADPQLGPHRVAAALRFPLPPDPQR
jgi:peptide subunit release factor 1 (eRF1)